MFVIMRWQNGVNHMVFKQVGFFRRVAQALTDTEKLNSPILVKESVESVELIEQYKKSMENTLDEKEREQLSQKIKLLELGLKGENSVLFELQNSFLPMHILRDVRIQYNDLKSQMDFVVLTRKFLLVMEVKNYFGNILVNEKGEFIRQVYSGNKLFQEGFYSPIRQVERQVEILSAYLKEKGAIKNTPIKNIVVFTNNKTVLNTKRASEQVKKKILRVDGLVEYLKRELEKPSPVYYLDNSMNELSEFIKESHLKFVNEDSDSVEMKLLEETINDTNRENILNSNQIVNDSNLMDSQTPSPNETTLNLQNTLDGFHDSQTSELEKALKQFRLQKAKEQNVKAFYVFTNRTLEELIMKKPTTIEALKKVNGIGEAKINAFGEELIQLIKRYK